MDQETRDKVARLPVWAKELIKHLEALPSALAREAANLRRENSGLREKSQRLSERVEAMTELFRQASKGGSDYAAAVVEVLEGYEIYPTSEDSVVSQ